MMRIGSALVVLALGVAACGGEPEPGTVTGDVFVALETGEEVNVAGSRVHLVPEAPEVDSLLAGVCAERQRALAQAEQAADSTQVTALRAAAVEQAWQRRAALLGSRSAQSAVTGADARFAFDSVPAGEYRLWTDATVQGDRWTWLHPVEVRGGDSTAVSLDNSNPDEDPFRCHR
ncbi:MAG TPA: hypothetical protein VFX98_11525 [Longimicrobiaceae bacterium]|nr:hypothetical protein [Longimicrobiaceae bacterium]